MAPSSFPYLSVLSKMLSPSASTCMYCMSCQNKTEKCCYTGRAIESHDVSLEVHVGHVERPGPGTVDLKTD